MLITLPPFGLIRHSSIQCFINNDIINVLEELIYDSCDKFRNLEFSIDYDESKISIADIKRIIDNY